MREICLAVFCVVGGFVFLFGSFWSGVVIKDILAVEAPKADARQKAEAGRQKDIKRKAKEQRESGCLHGKDAKTGKCYEPREGQFYRDSSTGEVKVKKIEKINLPWNQDKNKIKEPEKAAEKKEKKN